MLVIRPQQQQEFADRLLEQAAFDRTLRFFPALSESLGRGLRPAIRRAVRKARDHGFSAQTDALHFVYLALILGEDFDQDPELPWARRILMDPDPARRPFRATRLYDSATRHLRAQEARTKAKREAQAR